MLRIPGPTCGIQLGQGWVDAGTSAVTRMPSEYQFASGPMPARHLPPLSPAELQLLVALDFAGIGNINERAMFLAQVSVESGGFKRLREGLRYSPDRLLAVFHKYGYVKDKADAEALVKGGSDAIANRVYGPTHKGLGNVDPGDGARYIGRGYMQLTGRENYRKAGEALGLDLVGHPELVEEPGTAARTAVWYWNARVSKTSAQLGDVRTVTKNINGGHEGLKERTRLFRHYQKLLIPTETPHEPRLTPARPAEPLPFWVLP